MPGDCERPDNTASLPCTQSPHNQYHHCDQSIGKIIHPQEIQGQSTSTSLLSSVDLSLYVSVGEAIDIYFWGFKSIFPYNCYHLLLNCPIKYNPDIINLVRSFLPLIHNNMDTPEVGQVIDPTDSKFIGFHICNHA